MTRRTIEVAPQNIVDRVVSYFRPGAGLERLEQRTRLNALAGGYNGGRRERRPTKRWRPAEGSPDADTLPDLPDLRSRSRELARNMPIAAGAIATAVTNVIGDGLALQASIDTDVLGISDEQADIYEREQEREFALFCRSADFTRVQCFDELQELAYRATKESGDVLVVRRFRKDPGDAYGTKLQILEADRLSNPERRADGVEGEAGRIAGGVETDRHGVPVAYHVSDRHPGAERATSLKWERIPARDSDGRPLVLHLFDRLRPELTRGAPWLSVVIEHLKQLGDYSDAEVTAAVTSGMITVAIETAADENDQPVVGETDSSLADNEVKLGNGAIISLAPGEKANLLNPSRPNANFDPFVLAVFRQVGVALELPFELLIKHFTASYSASRAALEMGRATFRKWRGRFAYCFCQEVYGWAMEEAVASGRINRPGFFADPIVRAAWLGAEWIGPATISLNPKQEAEADEIDMRNGAKTLEQVCIERTGGEAEKKIPQRGKEEAMKRANGLVPPPAAPSAASGAHPPTDPDAKDEADE